MSREVFKRAAGYYLDTVAAIRPEQSNWNASGVWNPARSVGPHVQSFHKL